MFQLIQWLLHLKDEQCLAIVPDLFPNWSLLNEKTKSWYHTKPTEWIYYMRTRITATKWIIFCPKLLHPKINWTLDTCFITLSVWVSDLLLNSEIQTKILNMLFHFLPNSQVLALVCVAGCTHPVCHLIPWKSCLDIVFWNLYYKVFYPFISLVL